MDEKYELMTVENKIDLYLDENKIDEGVVSALISASMKKGSKFLLVTVKEVLVMALRELSREIQHKLSVINTNTLKSKDVRRHLIQLNREANFHKSRYIEILEELEAYAAENWENYSLQKNE